MACQQGALTPPDTLSRTFGTCKYSTCWDQSFSELVVVFPGYALRISLEANWGIARLILKTKTCRTIDLWRLYVQFANRCVVCDLHSNFERQTHQKYGLVSLVKYITNLCTAAIFLSNDHSLYAPITSDVCHAWFHLYRTNRPFKSASKATNNKWKSLVHSGTRTNNLQICSAELYRLSYSGLLVW